jgi:hypothetical protein
MKEAAEAWKALRGKTYPCDPAKNTTCTKTGCYYVNGGDCYQTTNPDYKREADPVKHGRWVKQTDENCWWYECSECGDYPLKNAYGHEVLSKYCPNCGARMREDGEDDE